MMFGLEGLPVRMDRKAAATFITQNYFRVAPRSLERWPLDEVYVNGRVMLETHQLVTEAERRLAVASAPPDPRKRRVAAESAACTPTQPGGRRLFSSE
jgi:hypothetical protein